MFYASPFKLSMFMECPRRYKFQYIDGLAEQFKVPKPHFTMGENVHEALKDFFKKTEPDKRNQKNLEEILRKIWRKNRKGFKNRDEEKKFGLEALAMLDNFAKTQDIKIKPLELEKMHKLPIDKEIILQGKIDRIDKDGDKIIIIDYKTGSEPQEEDLLQLIIYSIIISKKLNKEINKASYLYLKSGKEKSIKPSKEDLDNGIIEIKSMVEMIEKEKNFKPNINKFCSWCEYLSICPMKEEIVKNKGNFPEESPF